MKILRTLLVTMLLLAAATACAQEQADGPGPVFARVARGWEDGNARVLAALVHPDGLRVTRENSGGRVSQYSPSQAYYYFRNLFQAHRTLVFEFDMTQDGGDRGQVHGMATWKRRRPDSERIQTVQLVCTLMRTGAGWRLAEINTIR